MTTLFDSIAHEWWDESGPMAPLHSMNPHRIRYILDSVPELTGKSILDVGCGAGILTEPLARLGAIVTGIDEAPNNIKEAQSHWSGDGEGPTYIHTQLQDFEGQFDIVTAMEVIEHVSDPEAFMKDLRRVLKPGGTLVMSTLNRTPLSYGVAILGAEYILKVLPKGTHNWHDFIKPSELAGYGRKADLEIQDFQGICYNPIYKNWSLTKNMSINYMGRFRG